MSKTLRALVVVLIFYTQALTAGTMSIGQYSKYTSGNEIQKNLVMLYINGVLDGFGTSNADLSYNGRTKLFCAPANLDIDYRVAEGLADSAIASHHFDKDANIGVVILLSLERSFPCKDR